MTQILEVLLPLPLPPFDFLASFEKPLPALGCRVVVPWQKTIRLGLVVAHKTLPAMKVTELREVIAVIDEEPFILESAIKLIAKLAEYSAVPRGVVLKQLLAVGLDIDLEHKVRTFKNVELAEPINKWQPATECDLELLDFYRRQGLLEERVRLLEKSQQVLIPLEFLAEAEKNLAGKQYQNQRRALEVLWEVGSVESAAALSRLARVPGASVRALVKKEYAGYERRPLPVPDLPHYPARALPEVSLELPYKGSLSIAGGLRLERLAALVPLLEKTVARAESVLLLVPEVAFLQGVVAALIDVLPVRFLNGDLSDAQRLRVWQELQEAPVVLVATYFGLLAPFPKLTKVVVLDHASNSYKLLSGSRIFVPTAAKFLAEIAVADLILSDILETPEVLTTFLDKERFVLPVKSQRIHLTDLTHTSNWPLSADLIRVIKQVVQRKRQAIILTPRRGFSAALQCVDCGYVAGCPNCDLPLRYYRQNKELRCYQCSHQEVATNFCPVCNSSKLLPARAAGTEWVLETIKKVITNIPIFRFDKDERDDLVELFAGKPGILVGTTAILRQKPLPNVSLIAHTLLDSHFDMGDFRAAETTYRLLLNLAELAVNQRPLVVLQTFKPKHEVLEYFLTGNAQGFLEKVLERRKKFDYPPFRVLAKLQVSAKKVADAEREAGFLAGVLRTHLQTFLEGELSDREDIINGGEVLGPVPAPILRVRGLYHYQLFVRAGDYESLRRFLEPALSYKRAVKVRIDVDPREMLGILEV